MIQKALEFSYFFNYRKFFKQKISRNSKRSKDVAILALTRGVTTFT